MLRSSIYPTSFSKHEFSFSTSCACACSSSNDAFEAHWSIRALLRLYCLLVEILWVVERQGQRKGEGERHAQRRLLQTLCSWLYSLYEYMYNLLALSIFTVVQKGPVKQRDGMVDWCVNGGSGSGGSISLLCCFQDICVDSVTSGC